MNDTLSAGDLHDLQMKYKNDKHIDSLVLQMADLYAKHATPVDVLEGSEGAVTSVLPPDIQAQWDALNEVLEDYKKAKYPLLPKEE